MLRGMVVDTWRDVLKERKKAKGLTNERIAELANTTESVVQRFFSPVSDPPLSQIKEIADVLDVPIEELFVTALPNGMKLKDLLEEYTRVTEELRAKKDECSALRDENNALKDELLNMYRRRK